MDSLRDALKGALAPNEGLVARDPSPQDDARRAPEPLDPTGSAWLTELARHTKIPKDTKTSTLRQLTDRLVKELATAGKGRDSRALADARDAWTTGISVFSQTEVFRFYGGPIDAPDTGPEGRINAWPLDEAYLDYVEGQPEAGLVQAGACLLYTSPSPRD